MKLEDKNYYEALYEMFASEGWKYFVEDHEGALVILKETAHVDCTDNSSWQERRGEINKLTHLLNYETFIKASFDSIEKETALDEQLAESYH